MTPDEFQATSGLTTTITHIRVHPGIGMARLGNSQESFIGPEAPGIVPDPGGTGGPGPNGGNYKDAQNQIKRQAQRFRVYGYDAQGNVVQEINATSPGVSKLNWRVHVRNMKAANYAFQGAYLFDPKMLRNPDIQPGLAPIKRDKLIVDPGPQTIGPDTDGPVILTGSIFKGVGPHGDGTGLTLPTHLQFEPPQATNSVAVPVNYAGKDGIELGRLTLDAAQRLVFMPGSGKAESLTSPAVVLGNPSEHFNPPSGPDPKDPLTNQFSYFNVPGWYDDTCGGEIDATVTLADGRILSTRDGVSNANDEGTRNAANGAWVVVGPPKYSPYMYHVVSILDRVFEVFPQANPNQSKPTNFYRDIFPILDRATNYAWVSAEAYGPQGNAHGPKQPGNLLSAQNLKAFTDPGPGGANLRKQIYALMRHPEDTPDTPEKLPPAPPTAAPAPRKAGSGPPSRGNQMPKLWGTGGKPSQNLQLGHNLPNQYLSLTTWQLKRMEDWAGGKFEVGAPIDAQPLESLALPQQPLAMDCAALEPTIGGGFHPGIEFPYLIMYKKFFAEAFRVADTVEPGSLAAYMSSPWQGDFWSCNTAWWPVQRPEIVVEGDGDNLQTKEWFRGYDPADGAPLSSTDGYDQMVRVWWQLGMVLPVPSVARDGGTAESQNTFKTNDGETVFREFERDPALDKKLATAKTHHTSKT